ncbi:MAG: hypothetical protein VYA34_16785 [Myxococcota bacterium]|nr:hypothetical protein [Myxococcota bacterium]
MQTQRRIQYAGLYLLRLMQDPHVDAAALIAEDEDLLTPILTWLIEQSYAIIDDKSTLQPTSTGIDVANQFEKRYQTLLRDYDVFCAVDLEAGEFGLAYYDRYPDADDWQAFLAEERWDDLRIAVAEYEGVDPIEIIFMSLVSENRFGRDEGGWDFDLLLGSVWDEMSQVCENAVKVAELGYDDGGHYIAGTSVIQEIIHLGRELMTQL